MIRRAALLLPLLLAGCGYGLLQTARTTPKGELDAHFGAGLLGNAMVAERGITTANVQTDVGLRYGLGEQTDLGLRLFLLSGGLVDAKQNLLPADAPFALAVSGGFGFASGLSGGTVYLVPVTVLFSWERFASIKPYGAVGYGAYWVYGRDPELPPGAVPMPRAGHGDGVLTVTGGLALPTLSGKVTVFIEGRLWRPVLDDPGDLFAFVPSGQVLVGLRARTGK